MKTKSPRAQRTTNGTSPTGASRSNIRYCSEPLTRPRAFAPDVHPGRAAAIIEHGKKWVNGTVITYAFFAGPERQKRAMRTAFKTWKDVGIGLSFREVPQPADAMMRIAFANDGSWSYLGRDVLTIPRGEPTLNIGWDITGDLDTGVHEIGHTLGMPHEHQNPNAGIVWNEAAVYADLGGPPNNWSREKTYHNIIRKLDPADVRGSQWDPNSVMHYPFKAGLIQEPAPFRQGLNPAGGLSQLDIQWVRTFYPAIGAAAYPRLVPDNLTELKAAAGQQADFLIKPERSGEYEIRTFGETDAVMVLFEQEPKRLRYLTADDDSGTKDNAHIKTKLSKGKTYILRVRVMHVDKGSKSSVLLW